MPLAALADRGHALPGLPRYEYNPRPGDAYGYYSAMRELLSAWRRPVAVSAVVLVALCAGLAVWALVRRGRGREWIVLAIALGLSGIGTVLALAMRSAGAPTVGWPLLWSVPLLPYRAAGLDFGPNLGFAVGLTLCLLANAVVVVATAIVAVRSTGRLSIAAGAVAGLALWPFIVGVLGGHRAWGNGTWEVDTGLHLYSEPLSTALVVCAVALLLGRRLTPPLLAAAGVLLSYAAVVRLSNAVIGAAVLLVCWAWIGARRSIVLLLGLLTFAPVEIAYWSKGYAGIENGLPSKPFALRYIHIAWTDSLLWTPKVLLIVLPLAVLGSIAVTNRWHVALFWSAIAATAVFYSFYAVTDIHPRFFYVVFPFVVVLWMAGVRVVGSRLAALRGTRPPSSV